jgi:[ribosomal protein S18]-alanine N-acetyltransferase
VPVAMIREMRRRDIPAIMEIEQASFITPWTEGMFSSHLKFRDRAINLVLLEGEMIVGYAAAWLAADEIHLLSIAVAPEKRTRGFGDELLRAVMENGRARGGVRVILEVREGNETARRFYRAHDFSEIGRRRAYYSDTGEDAIVMELVLGL